MLCGSIVYRSAASTILMYLRAARCWVALWKRCSLKPARCAFEKKISDDCSSYSSSRYVEIAAFTKSNLNPIPDPTRTNKQHSVVSIQLNIDTRPQWRRNEFESGAPVQRECGRGHRSGAKRRKFFLVVPLHFFASKSTTSRFGERFRDCQYSLVSFLFAVLLLTVPPYPVICKSGSRRHCTSYLFT